MGASQAQRRERRADPLTIYVGLARDRANRDISVTPQVGIDVLLDHYDYLKRLVGPDHVGVGTDFIWGNLGGPWMMPVSHRGRLGAGLDAGPPPGTGRLEG